MWTLHLLRDGQIHFDLFCQKNFEVIANKSAWENFRGFASFQFLLVLVSKIN